MRAFSELAMGLYATALKNHLAHLAAEAGERYLVRVFAVLNTGEDVNGRPFKPAGFPFCQIPAISGTIAVP